MESVVVVVVVVVVVAVVAMVSGVVASAGAAVAVPYSTLPSFGMPPGTRKSFQLPWQRRQQQMVQTSEAAPVTCLDTSLKGSKSDYDDYDDYDERDEMEMESFRRMLESSWDADKMGSVPTSPNGAAAEACACIRSAVAAAAAAAESADNGSGSGGGGGAVVLVDVHLPSLDATRGPNIYDEVMATEFCVALAAEMRRSRQTDATTTATATTLSLILVRDGKVANDVGRVLHAKERSAARDRLASTMAGGRNDRDDDGKDAAGADASSCSPSGNESDSDIDSFRKMLISTWNDDTDEDDTDDDDVVAASVSSSSSSSSSSLSSRPYRLSSLFGTDDIPPKSTSSSTNDVFAKAISSVDRNVLPTRDENVIIVLSPTDDAELVAVRRIVQKFASPSSSLVDDKIVVLVNCRLDPLPNELLDAQVAYSMRPLIARAASSTAQSWPGNIGSNTNAQQQDWERDITKVVVMRRHPGDWEVYIDSSDNDAHDDDDDDDDNNNNNDTTTTTTMSNQTRHKFQLVQVLPANELPRDQKGGPDMSWIASVVKNHLRQTFIQQQEKEEEEEDKD